MSVKLKLDLTVNLNIRVLMSKSYTLKESWTIRGRYYGFPECCIQSFLTLSHVGGPDRKLDGTGYIPCLDCNEKSEEELIAQITANRKSRLPFPKTEKDKIENEHLHSIIKDLL